MKKWKKISQKLLLAHPRIRVYEDVVELPDGTRTTYVHQGEPKSSSSIISVRDDGKILVQKEYSYPPNEWLFQFPGGAIEANETPLQAAKRELSEEANLTGDLEYLGWFYIDNRRQSSKMHVFVGRKLLAKPGVKDHGEEFEDHWMNEDEITQKIRAGEIKNYSILAALSLYKARF